MQSAILTVAVVLFGLTAVLGSSTPQPGRSQPPHMQMLGTKECTYGPSYWCQNITNSANCRATKHCIQTVWVHKQYPEDNSNVCQICKDMVTQARNQLTSNETEEEIKDVFEGSCALMHIRPIVKECDKLVDNFIPDLIDTLASEMDPNTVCSVAGLCNSVKIKQLFEESTGHDASETVSNPTCTNCFTVMDVIVEKFRNSNQNDLLDGILEICGKMGSFSDACSNLVINNIEDLYNFLKTNLNTNDICLLSGECSTTFHRHEDIEITPLSKIGYVNLQNEKDDLPCDICEQLVTHFRDILIANTTEAEFKLVLEGLCKQTKQSFTTECLAFVQQYYDLIYRSLVRDLNSTYLCEIVKICPAKNLIVAPIAPLLSIDTAEKLHRNAITKSGLTVKVIKPQQDDLSPINMQLPIDLLVPPHQQIYNQQFCIFCQYFLHYVQQEISNPVVQNDVKKVIDGACAKLPKSVNETCVEFVNTYEPALLAILAQEIDPSQVCPLIKACPSEHVKDVDIFMSAKSSSECPLCLYAVTELESMIKNNKSKDEIKKDLERLCSVMPSSLKPECVDFVDTYEDELIDMLIADFKPQEVCVYLKLCTDNTPVSEELAAPEELIGGDIETNIIYDTTIDGRPVEGADCVLCEFVMKEIDDQLKDKKTDDEIKAAVLTVCKILPTTISSQCNNFVTQYADVIITLLQEALNPSQICAMMHVCSKQFNLVREEISNCGVCRDAATIMQTVLKNPKIDQSVEHIFEKTCRGLPENMKKSCKNITEKHGIALVSLLSRSNTDANSVCNTLSYCSSTSQVVIN